MNGRPGSREAMILAAGLGTRLRPLTDGRPKALVEVAGVPMLERVARRLIAAGVDRLVINVHHHADQIERFVAARRGFGVGVRLSREEGDAPLDTGGGLLAAASLFDAEAPFFLHNVDVISEVDLAALYDAHVGAGADADSGAPTESARPAGSGGPPAAPGTLATLAVQRRETSRPLLVDDEGVYGVADHRSGYRREARPPAGRVRERAFAGIHVVSPELFRLAPERGRFPIWDPYLRLVGEGYRVNAYDIGAASWLEVGSPERLALAERALSGR